MCLVADFVRFSTICKRDSRRPPLAQAIAITTFFSPITPPTLHALLASSPPQAAKGVLRFAARPADVVQRKRLFIAGRQPFPQALPALFGYAICSVCRKRTPPTTTAERLLIFCMAFAYSCLAGVATHCQPPPPFRLSRHLRAAASSL